MSVDTALKALGLVVVAYFFVFTVLAMGPIGWIFVGFFAVMAVITVHKKRGDDENQTASEPHRRPSVQNCPDCGSPNDPDRSRCDYCDAMLEAESRATS